jgi:glutamate-1-semialdehyde aminotransferase
MTGIHFTKTRPRNYTDAKNLRWSKTVEKALHLYMRINNVLYMDENTTSTTSPKPARRRHRQVYRAIQAIPKKFKRTPMNKHLKIAYAIIMGSQKLLNV